MSNKFLINFNSQKIQIVAKLCQLQGLVKMIFELKSIGSN